MRFKYIVCLVAFLVLLFVIRDVPSFSASFVPTIVLTLKPSSQPTSQAASQPSIQPSSHPSNQPASHPSIQQARRRRMEFKKFCGNAATPKSWLPEKRELLGAAWRNGTISLESVLQVVSSLEKLGEKAEALVLNGTNKSNHERIHASLFDDLLDEQRKHKDMYIRGKAKIVSDMQELVPRKKWLQIPPSRNLSKDIRWVQGNGGKSCAAACQALRLNCDAREMYLSHAKHLRKVAAEAGLKCLAIFEQPWWGQQWDGPWVQGGECGYIPHNYWIADCNLGCNFVRLCPCSNQPGQQRTTLPAVEPRVNTKQGAFASLDIMLPLSHTLMDRSGGIGGEERATVGHEALKCLGPRCLVYSFGAGYETKYEQHMASFGCRVHVFDCTMTSQPTRLLKYLEELVPLENVVFHPWCVGEPMKNKYQSAYGQALDQFYTLDEVMKKLGHSSVDVLKFDIEGFEWKLFESLLRGSALPDQLAFELHTVGSHPAAVPPELVKLQGQYEVNELFQAFFSLGYTIANKEMNAADGACCEFVLVRVAQSGDL